MVKCTIKLEYTEGELSSPSNISLSNAQTGMSNKSGLLQNQRTSKQRRTKSYCTGHTTGLLSTPVKVVSGWDGILWKLIQFHTFIVYK